MREGCESFEQPKNPRATNWNKVYEQIPNMLIVGCVRHDACRFLPKPGDDCNHTGRRTSHTGSDETAALQNIPWHST